LEFQKNYFKGFIISEIMSISNSTLFANDDALRKNS
jgi:hypothetical protein